MESSAASPLSPPTSPAKPDKVQNTDTSDYLHSLLNKNLRVTVTDGRMFRGCFQCTDPQSNIILQQTYEYRQPSTQKLAEMAATNSGLGTVRMDMTSRYLGLIVVPGEHIVRIEVEEFASQMPKPTENTTS